jgi:hypothetical protein
MFDDAVGHPLMLEETPQGDGEVMQGPKPPFPPSDNCAVVRGRALEGILLTRRADATIGLPWPHP